MPYSHVILRCIAACYHLMGGRIPVIIGMTVPQIVNKVTPRITEILTIYIHIKLRVAAIVSHRNVAYRGIIALLIGLAVEPVSRCGRPLELVNFPRSHFSVVIVNTVSVFQPPVKFLKICRSVIVYVVAAIYAQQIRTTIVGAVHIRIRSLSRGREAPSCELAPRVSALLISVNAYHSAQVTRVGSAALIPLRQGVHQGSHHALGLIFQRYGVTLAVGHNLAVLFHPFTPLLVGNEHSHGNVNVAVGGRVAVRTILRIEGFVFPCRQIRAGKVICVRASHLPVPETFNAREADVVHPHIEAVEGLLVGKNSGGQQGITVTL